jgi:hypothetical protein
MTKEQLQERFRALLELVESVHTKCKTGPDSIESMVDNFYECHFLMQSFMKDCSELITEAPEFLLQVTMVNISNALQCSVNHLIQYQDKFNTNILSNIIHNFVVASESQNKQELVN